MKLMTWLLALALVAGLATSAPASEADVAMFYDALAPLGNWVDYANYGPVWYPRGVGEDWRPYLNGRWLPTEDGWAFETDEAWAWATYHFGNWMPTEEYGWVWVPGSTWYPNTAAWRTSDAYVGWAPVPPPDYVPGGPFAPADGYNPDAALIEQLTAPFWALAEAANFLLGLEEAYGAGYSYGACGCLAPPEEVPDLYPDLPLVNDFYSPSYAPDAYYCFGPPIPFIAAVVHIDVTVINNFVKKVKIGKLRHALPPKEVLDKHPHLKDAVPAAVREGEGFKAEPVKDGSRVAKALNRPHVVPPPKDVPRLKEEIPKALLVPRKERGPGALKGIKGMELPPKAVKETPKTRPRLQPSPQLPAPPGPGAPPRLGEQPQRLPAEPPRPQEQQRVLEERQRQLLEQQRQREEQQRRALEEQQQRRQQQQLLRQKQMEEQLLRRQELLRQQQERQRELQLRQQEMRQRQQEQLRQQELQRQELQRQRELQQQQPDLRPGSRQLRPGQREDRPD